MKGPACPAPNTRPSCSFTHGLQDTDAAEVSKQYKNKRLDGNIIEHKAEVYRRKWDFRIHSTRISPWL